jgi:hypothetical protein
MQGTIVKQKLQEFAEILARFDTETVVQVGPSGWKVLIVNQRQTVIAEVELSYLAWNTYDWQTMTFGVNPAKLVEFLRVIPRNKIVTVEFEPQPAENPDYPKDRLVLYESFNSSGQLRRNIGLVSAKDIPVKHPPSPPPNAVVAILDFDLVYKFVGKNADGDLLLASNGRELVLGALVSEGPPIRLEVPPSSLQEIQTRGSIGPFQRVVVAGGLLLMALKGAGRGDIRFTTDNVVEVDYSSEGLHAHWYISPIVREGAEREMDRVAQQLLAPKAETILASFTIMSDIIKPVIEAHKALIDVMSLTITRTSWKMTSVDAAHVVLVGLQLDSNQFSRYSPPAEETQFGLTVTDMWDFVRKRPKNTDVEFQLTEDHLIAISEGETLLIARVDVPAPRPPELAYTHLAEVPLKVDVLKFLKDAAAISDYLMFIFHPNALILGAIGETDTTHMKIAKDEMPRYKAPKTIINAYSLSYITKILRSVKAPDVTFETKDTVPIKMSWDVAGGVSIMAMMAPRVQDEGLESELKQILTAAGFLKEKAEEKTVVEVPVTEEPQPPTPPSEPQPVPPEKPTVPPHYPIAEALAVPIEVKEAVLKVLVEKADWLSIHSPEIDALGEKYGFENVHGALPELVREGLVEERRDTGIHIFRAVPEAAAEEEEEVVEDLSTVPEVAEAAAKLESVLKRAVAAKRIKRGDQEAAQGNAAELIANAQAEVEHGNLTGEDAVNFILEQLEQMTAPIEAALPKEEPIVAPIETIKEELLKLLVERKDWVPASDPALMALVDKYGPGQLNSAANELEDQGAAVRAGEPTRFKAIVTVSATEAEKDYAELERDLLVLREDHPEWHESVNQLVMSIRDKRGILQDEIKRGTLDQEHYLVQLEDIVLYGREGYDTIRARLAAPKTSPVDDVGKHPQVIAGFDKLKKALDKIVRAGAMSQEDAGSILENFNESVEMLNDRVKKAEQAMDEAVDEMVNAINDELTELEETEGGAEREEEQEPPAVPIEEENEPEPAEAPGREVDLEDLLRLVNKEMPLVTVMDTFVARGYEQISVVEAVQHLVSQGRLAKSERKGIFYLAPIGTPLAKVEELRQPAMPKPARAPEAPMPLTAEQRDSVRKVASSLPDENLEEIIRTGLIAGAPLVHEALGLFQEEFEARKALGVSSAEHGAFVAAMGGQATDWLLSELNAGTLKEWQRKAIQEIIDRRSAAHGRDWGEVTAMLRQTTLPKLIDDIMRAVRNRVWTLTQKDVAELERMAINRKLELAGKIVKVQAARPEEAAKSIAQVQRESPVATATPTRVSTTMSTCQECGANFINLDWQTLEVLKGILPYSSTYYELCPTCKKELAGFGDLNTVIDDYIPIYIRRAGPTWKKKIVEFLELARDTYLAAARETPFLEFPREKAREVGMFLYRRWSGEILLGGLLSTYARHRSEIGVQFGDAIAKSPTLGALIATMVWRTLDRRTARRGFRRFSGTPEELAIAEAAKDIWKAMGRTLVRDGVRDALEKEAILVRNTLVIRFPELERMLPIPYPDHDEQENSALMMNILQWVKKITPEIGTALSKVLPGSDEVVLDLGGE